MREYRIYFHIGASYGISKSSAYQPSRCVEEVLIKHPDFALPRGKALIKSDVGHEVVFD
jgi:hypothetical protein